MPFKPWFLLQLKTLRVMAVLGVAALALSMVSVIQTEPYAAWLNIKVWPSDTRQTKGGSHVRGIHQTMTIFAHNNNTYLPGLPGPAGATTQPTPPGQPGQPTSNGG